MATEVLEEATEPTLTRRRATIEEFWSLPETMLPVEYVNGEIVMAPTPTVRHQRLVRKISFALLRYVEENNLGEIFFSPLDVILPTGEVVQPDIFLLTPKQAARAAPEKRVHEVPPFAVEILSPGTATHDMITKRELYEKNGVREYWIVDVKKRSIAQLVLRKKHYVVKELGEGDTIRGAALEGFEMKVGELIGSE
ncbi:MAG: Uma2 family endonuclease [Acidobacteriota bacterium]|nr:Uma2 family endonuclease [Acidobacteriota bacterium]